MNKRQKIIVSIVGITIVMLALLGLTYAYYLTRIEGNTNTNSISITTANLKLAYGDGNEIITASNIVPNTVVSEKTFTVTNTGNNTIDNYRVVLELASIEGVVPSVFKYPKDFQITLTCISKNNTTNEVSGTCDGYSGYWDNESFEMQKNTIESGIRHEYSLVIKYVDSGIDQSDDMGKNLNLKVQIYGEKDTSTLNGTITGVDSTYAMKLNSNPKASTLKPTSNTGEYRYSFIGVEPGTHTLSLVNKDGEIVSSETITINKGTETNVNGSTITVSDNQSTIHLTTSSSGTSLSSTATFNPYDSNTNSLAYHIINNAKTNKNGTKLLSEPATPVAESLSILSGVTTINEFFSLINGDDFDYGWGWMMLSYASSQHEADNKIYNEDYACNGEEYEWDPANCPNKQICEDAKGQYLSVYNIYIDEDVKPTPLGKVLGCTEDGMPLVFGYTDEYESSISTELDDYGISYYYRGAVEDNYVNFAGMCWRIVRIQGDGSVKLILEDKTTTCDSDSFIGNWSAGAGNYGYDNTSGKNVMKYLEPVTNANSSMAKAFYNFQNTLATEEKEKLKSGDWCLNDITYTRNDTTPYNYTLIDKSIDRYTLDDFYYDSFVRLSGESANGYQPTLKCNGTVMDKFKNVTYDGSEIIKESPMYVGTVTADEIMYAGGKVWEQMIYKTDYSYLIPNDYSGISNEEMFGPWTSTLSLSKYATSYIVEMIHNSVFQHSISTDQLELNFRPAIILKSGINISSGDGTQSNPYVVE